MAEDALLAFFAHANNAHPSINFTYHFGAEVDFMDSTLSIRGDSISSDLNTKPTDTYTISPGSQGSMAKSRHATAARGPAALGLPWRAEMQPNCPGYQERLCLSSWNRYSTRTGKARKNRTRKESFLARKNDRNFQPCEIANIRPWAEICNLTWLESADSVLAKQVPVQSSRVHVRSQNLATFIRLSDWSVPWLQTCDI